MIQKLEEEQEKEEEEKEEEEEEEQQQQHKRGWRFFLPWKGGECWPCVEL